MESVLASCAEAGTPTTSALTDLSAAMAGLIQRVESLERRLIKKRPDTSARRMTRPDRCPFGWRPHPRNPALLIEDQMEQRTILRLIEEAQNPRASYRDLARRLDSLGLKRRGGKQWTGSHSLVRSILRREGILTHEDARVFVQRRIEELKRRDGQK